MWIHASTVERIDQAYKEIARKAQLSGWDNPKTDKLTLVADWLSQDDSDRWLIVLDNADDADVFFNTNHDLVSKGSKSKPIASYIPHSTQGSVLITTRDQRVGERLANRVRAINVPPFTTQEAGDLLRSLLRKIDVGDEADAQELFDALAYLPLAVSQAAAFITENGITVSVYLEHLRAGDADIKDLLSEELTDSRRDAEKQNSVIQTWKLSFDHIRRSNPRAAKILSLMSVLDRQGIPKSLLRQDNENPIEFTKAIGMLQAFSLITTENSGISFEIHRLVHLATQKWLELQGEMNLWREEALKVISKVYPVGIFENWATCNSLGPHMQAVIEYTFDSKTCQLYSAALLSNALQYDLTQGRYDIALNKCTKVLTIREDLLGSEHPDTLTSVANLAATYWNQGRWKEAEELGWQVMETRKRILGREHLDTLTSMAGLAATYQDQGRWKEAEELGVQVVETRKRILGEEHLDTLISMAGLAATYGNQGRWKEAEGLEVQTMEMTKRVLGEEHPDTLTSIANLAVTYQDQGRWKEAEGLKVQVMETRKRVLGQEHPDTLTSIANLAVTYRDQGRWKEAEGLEMQVMETRKRVLGQEHPDTLRSMANLAATYGYQGRWKEAEGLEIQVIETRKRVLGQEHPDTLRSMASLVAAYGNQGRWKEAKGLGVQVMETSKRVLGQEHPDTLRSMVNLAATYGNQGRWKDAEGLEVQVVETRKRMLGQEHPDTLTSFHNLACTWKLQGRDTEAIDLMKQAERLRKITLGSDHPLTRNSTRMLCKWQKPVRRMFRLSS
jgi:tetratricopeptide (TPR) repeat protein